jgi:hypothetical protein
MLINYFRYLTADEKKAGGLHFYNGWERLEQIILAGLTGVYI